MNLILDTNALQYSFNRRKTQLPALDRLFRATYVYGQKAWHSCHGRDTAIISFTIFHN